MIYCDTLERKILDVINAKNNDHGKIDIMAVIDYNFLKIKVAVADQSINYKYTFAFAMDVKADQKAFEDYVVNEVSDNYLKYAEAWEVADKLNRMSMYEILKVFVKVPLATSLVEKELNKMVDLQKSEDKE